MLMEDLFQPPPRQVDAMLIIIFPRNRVYHASLSQL